MFDDRRTPSPDSGSNPGESLGQSLRTFADMYQGVQPITFDVKVLNAEGRYLLEGSPAGVMPVSDRLESGLEHIKFPLEEGGVRLLINTGSASEEVLRDLFLALAALHIQAGGTSELTMTITGLQVRGSSEVLFHPKQEQ